MTVIIVQMHITAKYQKFKIQLKISRERFDKLVEMSQFLAQSSSCCENVENEEIQTNLTSRNSCFDNFDKLIDVVSFDAAPALTHNH